MTTMKAIPICLVLLTTLSIPTRAETFNGLDRNCCLIALSQEDGRTIKKAYSFSHQGKSYKLVLYQDGTGTGNLSLEQGKSKRSIANNFTDPGFIYQLNRVSAKVFTFQVREGNGDNVPVKKYRLNLENPQQPKVTLIKKWVD
jgi:hypothetical protein